MLRPANDRIKATTIAFGTTSMDEFIRIAADGARRVAFESRKALLALPSSNQHPAVAAGENGADKSTFS